jgi:hypothetical protein
MGDKEYISQVGRSPDRFEPPEPLLLGLDPGVRDPRWDGDMNVKRLRDGVLGVDGGTEVCVDERGGVRGGSIIVVFADNSSPNISFLMRALYILSASSSFDELAQYSGKKWDYLAGHRFLLHCVFFEVLMVMYWDFRGD